MNISSVHGATATLDTALAALQHSPRISAQEKVGEACRQFEAVLLRQILGDARKSVLHSDPESDSAVSGVYQDMITANLADAISRSGVAAAADAKGRTTTSARIFFSAVLD